ncbi:hypothetical protein RDWZM_005323 [Blomia tropicalis]|uniref:Uncharacterized protein n=1 Tax=Blomia tropicalis TaxID=40697 RepID=A0A9Q0M555_BLOTA|nr:hypothetical protein RDWZM_005323 [Blomia tropicalis]
MASPPIVVGHETNEDGKVSPIVDCQLINVNITSSSPPDEEEESVKLPKMSITRANSAKQAYRGPCLRNQGPNSRKSSTITFQTPNIASIKRPNSTIGIPASVIPSHNHHQQHHQQDKRSPQWNMTPYETELNQLDSANSSNYNLYPMTTIETPDLDIFSNGFSPTVREKASSLTLPESKLEFLRKGSSNPFLMANSVSPGQYSLPSQRTSVILNGNILHSISPIPPTRPPVPSGSRQLSIHVQDGNTLGGSVNFADSRCLSSTLKPRGSTMSSMTNHRSSYIGDEEHYHLHQQYLATSGRKDTIISIGKNFQIQFKSPSTSGLSWSSRTRLERFLLFVLVAMIVVMLAYIYIPVPIDEANRQPCTTMECVKTASSLLSAMDLNADPCNDFFQFACGTWVKKHVIPEDRSSLSTFEVMADDLQIILKDLLEQVPNSADNSATLKAKRFYQSCMNIQKIENIGDTPIRDTLMMVGQWPVLDRNWDPNGRHFLKRTLIANSLSTTAVAASTKVDHFMPLTIENLLGKIRGDYNQPIIIEQYVGPDDRNSSHNIIQFDQTSFGLPSREYFLKEGANKEKEAYLHLMVDVAELLGAEREYAFEQMRNVLEFETELANASMPEADRHDTSAIYNKKTIQELKDMVPEFDWMSYLKSFMPIDVTLNDEVVVYSVNYYKKMGKILAKSLRKDKRVVINYAIWRLMKSLLPFLDGEFGVRRAKFRKVLFGISADRTRWSQCVELVNKKMGMAVGALFIRDNFDPMSKEIAIEMIHNIRQAFNELLQYNEWMDDETRNVAKEKADSINERIGYPDLLTNPIELSKEYNFLDVHEDKFLDNIMNVFRFEAHKNLIKLGTAVDKDSWTTDPAVVNAFYSPNKNDIVFPAGILQPLFYSHYFPKSLNYGGIGVVIGHEITHGFDDRGRQFDKNGNMKQWWNNATIKRFRTRAQCIIDQYSSYVLEDINTNVNGRMTQGFQEMGKIEWHRTVTARLESNP